MARRTEARGSPAAPRVKDVCGILESIAPLHLAAEWDNVGLLIGDARGPVRKLLLTIDLTAPVLREARRAGAEMVMAYHPVIFRPLARLTADAAPVALAAARAGVAVYAMHTALDAAPGGTNDVLAEGVGLVDARPLEPIDRPGDAKVVVFCPPPDVAKVSAAAFAAGAGRIGQYDQCSFRVAGVGTFRGLAGSRQTVGRAGRREQAEELRLEMIAPSERLAEVLEAIRSAHSYETPAIDVYALRDLPAGAGMGRIGKLARAVSVRGLVARVKRALGVARVQVAGPAAGKVTTVACGAGSCGGMFRSALAGGAQAYVTGEMRHHHALAAAAGGMTVICAGHSNSERITLKRLTGRIRRAMPGLKVALARADRDPLRIV